MFRRSTALASLVSAAGVCLAYPPLHLPYFADPGRVATVRQGTPAIRRCMDEGQVTRLLGEPDFRRTLMREGSDGKVPAMITMHYVLSQRSEELAETDAQVEVWMSISKRVKAVSVYGIPGLESLHGLYNEKCPT